MQQLNELGPTSFGEYIGQGQTKTTLQWIINDLSARMAEAPNSHAAQFIKGPSILLVGLPGLGKTTLARIYASTVMQLAKDNLWPAYNHPYAIDILPDGQIPIAPYRFATIEGNEVSSHRMSEEVVKAYYGEDVSGATVKSCYSHISRLLEPAKAKIIMDCYMRWINIQGVLFVDEIQDLRPNIQESMLRLMSDGLWHDTVANRADPHVGFSFVAATTDESKLKPPLLSRFNYVLQLQPYTDDEFAEMAVDTAARIGFSLMGEATAVMVDRSRRNPRQIAHNVNILSMVRRNTKLDGPITKEEAIMATVHNGIGPGGLTHRDAKVLDFLTRYGTTGEKTIIKYAGFGDSKNYDLWERFLIEMEYVLPGPSGRYITNKGREALDRYKKESSEI